MRRSFGYILQCASAAVLLAVALNVSVAFASGPLYDCYDFQDGCTSQSYVYCEGANDSCIKNGSENHGCACELGPVSGINCYCEIT